MVWSTSESAPTPVEFLAFDDDNGSIAYVDSRGRPVLIELRLGTITVQTTKKRTGLAAASAKSVFGIAANGDVVRLTPTGEWTYKPPRPARAVYPQPDGGLLVTIGTGAGTFKVQGGRPASTTLFVHRTAARRSIYYGAEPDSAALVATLGLASRPIGDITKVADSIAEMGYPIYHVRDFRAADPGRGDRALLIVHGKNVEAARVPLPPVRQRKEEQ